MPSGVAEMKRRQTYGHTPHVDGVETVHVLLGQDGFGDLLLIYVGGQGQLHYEAVYGIVGIEACHHIEEFALGDGVLISEQSTAETAGLAGQDLVADVCLATAVVTHQYGGRCGHGLPRPGCPLLHS